MAGRAVGGSGGAGGKASCVETLAMAVDPSIKRQRSAGDSNEERRQLRDAAIFVYANPRERFGPMREKHCGWGFEEVAATAAAMPKGLPMDDARRRGVERAANAAAGFKAKRVYTDEELAEALFAVAKGEKMAVVSRKSGVSVDTIEKYRRQLINADKWHITDTELQQVLSKLEFPRAGASTYLTEDEMKLALVAAAGNKLIGDPQPMGALRANISDALQELAHSETDPARKRRLELATCGKKYLRKHLARHGSEFNILQRSVKSAKLSQGRAAANEPELNEKMFDKIQDMYDQARKRAGPYRLTTKEPHASQIFTADEIGLASSGDWGPGISFAHDTLRSQIIREGERAPFSATVRAPRAPQTCFRFAPQQPEEEQVYLQQESTCSSEC